MVALHLKEVTKTYSGGLEALKGVDLQVAEGDFFGLLGPNGAGKSTLIGIIANLVSKSGGEVKVFGQDLDQDPVAMRRQIGLVPQEFNFSIFETVEQIVVTQAGFYGINKGLARERLAPILRQLDLWDKRNTQARRLSGGMKRRLMIARALMHQPRLLILDEPTAGVDIELRRGMWDFLLDLNRQGTTIVLTTHYLEEAEHLCQNLAIIDHGAIVENTTIENLLAKLNKETFVMDVSSPLPQELPSHGPFALRVKNSQQLELDITKPGNLNEAFSFLDQQGIKVRSMRNKANRLEELFLRLTAKSSGLAGGASS